MMLKNLRGDYPFISTNFLPYRLVAWIWYTVIGCGVMLGLYLAGVLDPVWFVAGPLISSLLGAFNVCEPNLVMRMYEEPELRIGDRE